MNIAIMEHHKQDLNCLITYITCFLKKQELNYQIHHYKDSTSLLQDAQTIDLAFINIELDQLGIDIGIKLRGINKDVRIIFTSYYARFLIEGYRANANRFFIKPFSQTYFHAELTTVLQDYMQYYASILDERISKTKLYVHHLLYIEFSNRKTNLHLVNYQVKSTTYSLTYWSDLLTPYSFAQPYKSLLVNLDYISAFTNNEVILLNNEKLPLSKHFKKRFESMYSHHLHKGIST